MKLFAATCLASVFAESNIANQMNRFRRDAGYETISFIDKETKAWGPQTAEAEYEKKGEIITIDDLDMYVVGDGPNAIIWNYHIYGFGGGRNFEYSDYFAENGFTVVLPDFFRGEGLTGADFANMANVFAFNAKHTNWTNIQNDVDNKILPYLQKERGISTFGTIGTCWGGYNAVRLASYPESEWSVIFHTSHPGLIESLGEDEAAIYQEINHDMLLLNSAWEPESVRAGGLMDQILGNKFQSFDYLQDHGFVTRGNTSIPEVKSDVDDALQRALDFANQHKYDYTYPSSASSLAESIISFVVCVIHAFITL